jgi:hypothetical protein
MTDVVTCPDWQDASAYRPLTNLHRSLLMWEWMRRDPSYQEFYIGRQRDLSHLPSVVKIIRLADDVAHTSWGLHFRRSP